MNPSPVYFVMAVVAATGVSGCCCSPCVQQGAEPSSPTRIPAAPTPPTPDQDRVPVVERSGVIAVVGRRQDLESIHRAADLLQERGIGSMNILGLGWKLIVDSDDVEAARAILRADPICSHLEIPDEGR